MKQIFKYPLELTDYQQIQVPAGACTLDVQEQAGTLYLWAIVDPDAKPEPKAIWIIGTGHPLPDTFDLKHVSTEQMSSFVWHIFE